ncbi:DNA cytosine methyltransferase [Pseudomonas simiae]|uniref:DNA cytosine methyltransferase n=1 Tax=Pseudomonas simiae TaxID=321846 RepID=UPI0018E3F929|nr:DNA cytosine methyltransferase [Pseudomonas simiae]QQD28851.1 DNA cytosine methyltransferase [Pseudomonas simiae]
MNELALFAGSGGGILGGHLLGWRTVCAVERDAYSAQVLAQRQNDGALATFPIWSDVCSFDGRPWRGLVDVVSGGFPCQDISAAGTGAGIDGARSGLWRQMARIIGEVRPRKVYLENSPLLVGRGLAMVLGDLAEMGYDAQWCIVSASDVGAPHQRDRCWLVAHDNGTWQSQSAGEQQERRMGSERSSQALADTCKARLQVPRQKSHGKDGQQIRRVPATSRRWPTEPGVGRMADGVAFRLDRIKALGNGQVPRVAATAFSILSIDD